MNKQILVSLLAAAVLVGAPAIASADDERDRKGSWKAEKMELRDYSMGRDGHKDKHKHKSPHDYGKEKHRYPGARYPFTGLDRFKYDDDHKAYRPRDRHHNYGGSYWYDDRWDRDDYHGKKHHGYRARQNRHHRHQQECGDQPSPDEQRHAHQSHLRCPHVENRDNDVDRTEYRRHTQHVYGQDRHIHTHAALDDQGGVQSPAGSRAASGPASQIASSISATRRCSSQSMGLPYRKP